MSVGSARLVFVLGLAIRYGHIEDVDAIADLVNRDVNRDPLERKFSKHAVEAMLARGSFLVLDRERGGLAGSVFLEIRDGRGEVGMLSVDPDLDSHNLPQRFIEVAEMVCVAAGCEALELRVHARPELPALGREMGFQALDDTEEGVRLEKRLG